MGYALLLYFAIFMLRIDRCAKTIEIDQGLGFVIGVIRNFPLASNIFLATRIVC